MKKGLLVLLLAAGSAFAGYWMYYQHATAPVRSMLSQSGGEMEWLRHEYHLSDAQFSRVRELHRQYAPKCDRMCENIANANARLDQIIKSSTSFTPQVDAAMNECVTVQAECRRALLRHIYEVSAEMSAADGARYLKMMTARIVEPGVDAGSVISQSPK